MLALIDSWFDLLTTLSPIEFIRSTDEFNASEQPPKFELADVHVSQTPRWFVGNYVQNNSGIVRDGRYIIRDASLLSLIQAAYGITDDWFRVGQSGSTWMYSMMYSM